MRATLLDDEPRIPVILGLCGTGRTTLLHQLQADLPPGSSQYVNVERTATTPERFLKALTASSPFAESREVTQPSSPREAFDAVLGFLSSARYADGSAATFLLD
jgi:ABC-type molybdenum transport system ATPase subunit/photorepair protein PhrA